MKGRGKTESSSVWGIGCGAYFPHPLTLICTSRDLLLHSIQSKIVRDPIIQEQLITINTTKNLVGDMFSALMSSQLARTASEQALAHLSIKFEVFFTRSCYPLCVWINDCTLATFLLFTGSLQDSLR